MTYNSNFLKALAALAFYKVVAADITEKNQEPAVFKGLYEHRIVNGDSHVIRVTYRRVIHQQIYLAPPAYFMPHPMIYGHHMPVQCMPFHSWHGPLHPAPYPCFVPPPLFKQTHQNHEDISDEGYVSSAETIDEEDPDDLNEKEIFAKICRDVDNLCGKSDKTPEELLLEFNKMTYDSPTSWASNR